MTVEQTSSRFSGIPLRPLAIAVALAALLAAPFLLWGGWFDAVLSQERLARWLAEARPVAWAACIALLVGDLVLPVPATGVMAALGSAYGIWLGSLVAVAGSCLAGGLGYGLCRLLGARAAAKLCAPGELARFEGFFGRWGAWAVMMSRMLPLLPEVVACLAGLARMPARVFALALLAGTIPACVLFAAIGSLSREAPAWGIAAAVLLPLAAWPLVRRLVSGRGGRGASTSTS